MMPINRKDLVDRHRVRLHAPDAQSPLSVGNGEFAFTADITGLQTFPEFHAQGLEGAGFGRQAPADGSAPGMQLGTLAQWGWHSMPNPAGYRLEDTLTPYQTPLIDPEVMRATLHNVHAAWDWPSTWGWDYPLMAMCAARLAEPALAVDALLMQMPKNTYLPNGHNLQVPGFLSLYLPGNGGLLMAIAMMAAGWDGSTGRTVPGFPADGAWVVQAEGLVAMP